MTYNRTAAATALLAEIDAWCARTRTPHGHVGGILFRHPGFVALLRKRKTVTEQKEREVRRFLADNPGGANHLKYPNCHVRVPKPSGQVARRTAGACPRCGGTAAACGYPSCPGKVAS